MLIVFKTYIHRILLFVTLFSLAILYFGLMDMMGSLSTIMELVGFIFGISLFEVSRKIIASYDIKELIGLCFSLIAMDWVLYCGSNNFKANSNKRYSDITEIKNIIW